MTDPMLIAFGVVVAVVALLVQLTIQGILDSRRKAWNDRVQPLVNEDDALGSPPDPAPRTESWNEQLDQGFERLVENARIGMPPSRALTTIALLAVLLAVGLYAWRGQFTLAVGGGLVGVGIPLLVLWFLRGRARAEVQEQLPDFLFLVSRSLRSGMNLEHAIRLTIEQKMQPISGYLRPMLAHLQLGLSLPQALRRVAKNIQSLDFDTFVSVVAFHRLNGGNLPLLMDRLGRHVRDRNQFVGRLKATTAQARFTAMLIGLAGPLLLAGYAVWQPEHVQPFFQSPWGWAILAGTLAVELVAALTMYRILRIDY